MPEKQLKQYRKAVLWDFDGPISHEARGLPEEKTFRSEKYPNSANDIHISRGEELATTLKVLAKNDVLSIIASQRITYGTDDEVDHLKKNMFAVSEQVFKPEGEFFRKADSEILNEAVPNADSTGTSKNGFLNAVKKVEGCELLATSDITLIDDNKNYENIAKEVGYNFIHVPLPKEDEAPINIRYLATVLVNNLAEGVDVYAEINKYQTTPEAAKALVTEVAKLEIENKKNPDKTFNEANQCYDELTAAKQEEAKRNIDLKNHLCHDLSFKAAMQNIHSMASELIPPDPALLEYQKKVVNTSRLQGRITVNVNDIINKKIPVAGEERVPFNSLEEKVLITYIDYLEQLKDKTEAKIKENAPSPGERFLNFISFGNYKKTKFESYKQLRAYGSKLDDSLKTLIDTDYCKALSIKH